MPRAQAGVAAAIAATSRQIGSSLGIAVIGAAVAAGARPAAWWIIAGCGAAILVLGAVTTGRRAAATAERVAAVPTADPTYTLEETATLPLPISLPEPRDGRRTRRQGEQL